MWCTIVGLHFQTREDSAPQWCSSTQDPPHHEMHIVQFCEVCAGLYIVHCALLRPQCIPNPNNYKNILLSRSFKVDLIFGRILRYWFAAKWFVQCTFHWGSLQWMPRVPETRPSLLPRGLAGYAGWAAPPCSAAYPGARCPIPTGMPATPHSSALLSLLPISRLRFCPRAGIGRMSQVGEVLLVKVNCMCAGASWSQQCRVPTGLATPLLVQVGRSGHSLTG